MKFRWISVLGAGAIGLCAIGEGCDQGSYAVSTCSGTAIPSGGCPDESGVSVCACDCSTAYSCIDGAWTFEYSCPAPEAGACLDSGGGTTEINGADAHICDAPEIDAPPGANGGPGCGDLQAGDCELGEVLSCGAGSCLELGCESLFYCLDGAWIFWGECTDDGGIVAAPRMRNGIDMSSALAPEKP